MTELSIYLAGAFICGGLFFTATEGRRDMRFAAFFLAVLWPASLLVILGGVIGKALIGRAQ